jgi:SSS family solute:Na+ symporter
VNVALWIIFAFAALALGLGLRASHGKEMNLEQWTVAGRGFGAIFVFLLLAGEIYTTFTFLGGSGWAYGKGAPTYYILCYGSLAYVLSYWLLPPIWRYARAHHLISQPHYFTHAYDSPLLGGLVALVGIVALIPYMVLQLKGLGIIVSTSSYGSISPTVAIFIGAAIVTAYVMVSGVHGSAWNAVIKDATILIIVVFLGVYLPLRLYGGYGAMFRAIDEARPGFLALPEHGQSVLWFSSSVLLSALGFYMWPHAFGAVFTARDAGVFRKNAIFLPLYQLILLFVFFVGFAAVLKVPGLTGGDVDLALFRISIQTFDPWFVGVVGGAGVLTALVPGSLILMAAATLLANDLVAPLTGITNTDRIAHIARLSVPVWALIAVWFAIGGGQTIVALLLMGYAFVTQLFPALIASLMTRNPVSPAGALAGIAAGVGMVSLTTMRHLTLTNLLPILPRALDDVNIGIAALVLNIVVCGLVSAVLRRPAPEAVTAAGRPAQ